MYAKVIVDIAHSSVDRVFEYAVPKDLSIQIGHRVVVPFGRGNGVIEGYVTELSESCSFDCHKVKSIFRTADDVPAFTKEQLSLAERIAKEYHCTMSESLRLMIPAQMRGQRVSEKQINIANLMIEGEELSELLDYTARRAKSQHTVLELLCQVKTIPVSDLHAICPQSKSGLTPLIKRGAVAITKQSVRRLPFGAEDARRTQAPVLTEDQQKAVDRVKDAMDGERQKEFLLHGITGSGKTEVYLAAIGHALSKGKSAIMLVPEISLTPQMVSRFRSRFGDTVAVIHSQLSAGERYDEWRRIRQGEAKVVIGARSAVFAPVENLGLLVIDEEHEQSYRSEIRPRYDAKVIARWRCSSAKAPLVLGSATPSVTTYFRCKERGRMELLSLPKRIGKSGLPTVHTCDMREELLMGNRSIFSGKLAELIRDRLSRNEQIMLFINLRGYAKFMMCRGCGHVIKCPHCDVSYTYHRGKYGDYLRCHYCGDTIAVPDVCPSCGKKYLKHFGIGTQQVEELVKEQFPSARVLRMDHDTTRQKDAHSKILKKFERGEADVLVGTQMIAKGLDFPNVTLVGVMAADSALYFPDYRSPERTFQLITQVAGRAGRAGSPGDVVVQTYNPEHFAVELACRQDYIGFYKEEIVNRRIAQFPPYALFMRALYTGEEAEARKASRTAGKGCEEVLTRHGVVPLELKFGPAPMAKRGDEARCHVLLKLSAKDVKRPLIEELYAVMESQSCGDKRSVVELDPLSMF
ncbi:MAG: primosomal protein N' [Clostridiales bacterium]|nr:primosomal protein N' [Clostridiales bacterium]